MMTCRLLLIIVLGLVAACGGQGAGDVQPNVVVVLVDDMRWDETGVAGHPYVQTPNIDRIANEGAYFENAFTTTPLCSPARATLLTGVYPSRHGITDNLARDEQSHRLETFPRMLEAAGYDTAFIGKWHMGNDDTPRPGFTHWAGMKGQGEAVNPELNIDGERRLFEGYVTDILTDLSLDFVSVERDAPFLLYLSHKALHPNITQLDDGSTAAPPSGVTGFVAAERHRGMYAGAEVPRRPNSGVSPSDKPALMRQIGDLPALGPATITSDETVRQRHDMLMAVDEGLGKIVERLEDRGILDDTLIVVTSDHGYWYGEHGLSAERRLAYEEALRIPMYARYPRRIEPGVRVDQIVLNVDLAPTVLDAAGVAPAGRFHGESTLPLMAGENPPWRTSFIAEYYSDTVFRRILQMGYTALRGERYKYIQYRDVEGMDELYDLQTDPYELDNLLQGRDNEALRMQLADEIARLRAELN